VYFVDMLSFVVSKGKWFAKSNHSLYHLWEHLFFAFFTNMKGIGWDVTSSESDLIRGKALQPSLVSFI
jgi:hypothetical protein